MLRRILVVCVVGFGLAASGCETPTEPSADQRRYESLLAEAPWTLGASRDSIFSTSPAWFRYSSGYCCRGLRVAASAPQWAAVWDTLVRSTPPPPPIPVDFATEMVVVALYGGAPTGGHSMVIRHVTRWRDTTFVLAEATRPGQNCITTQAVTSPADARVVPQAPPPTVLLVEERVYDCRTGTSRPEW